ncbi:MAG: hypothetical protein ACOZCO_11570 [Bacteroidota bacterium]
MLPGLADKKRITMFRKIISWIFLINRLGGTSGVKWSLFSAVWSFSLTITFLLTGGLFSLIALLCILFNIKIPLGFINSAYVITLFFIYLISFFHFTSDKFLTSEVKEKAGRKGNVFDLILSQAILTLSFLLAFFSAALVHLTIK